MKKIEDEKLVNIMGGATTITVGVARVLISLVELLGEAGRGLGSSIRRFSEDKICPLE